VSNALKHANASSINITFSSNDNGIELRVSDNGTGIASERENQGGGNGLRNMRTNAENANGELSIISDGGTQVALKIRLA